MSTIFTETRRALTIEDWQPIPAILFGLGGWLILFLVWLLLSRVPVLTTSENAELEFDVTVTAVFDATQIELIEVGQEARVHIRLETGQDIAILRATVFAVPPVPETDGDVLLVLDNQVDYRSVLVNNSGIEKVEIITDRSPPFAILWHRSG